ncbi:hypothetical protein [Nostoc sp.]|uniref:hypothetical protein n=1 Tax=Nostoc sp. TaxID=1180 RepID=UPI002FF7812F
MIGTREWISKVQEIIGGNNFANNKNREEFENLLIQGKQISQIISYIWLEEDKEAAQELDGYFRKHNNDNQKLKKLFFASESETDEYQLLLKVFKEKTHLPIFHKDDQELVNFRVVIDKFEGNISNPEPSNNGILTVTIPYPPRPQIFDDTEIPIKGYTTIKQSELKEWLNQAPDKEPYMYENNFYIPASSS